MQQNPINGPASSIFELEDENMNLRMQLAEKDKKILELQSLLKSKNDNFQSSKVENRANSRIKSLYNCFSESNLRERSELEKILNLDNIESQVDSLVSFIEEREKIIQRLCSQLRGHADFLTRLASSPNLQSLFLISDNSGTTFLEETTRSLLLEQAARTSKLIAEHPNLNTAYGNVNTRVSLDVEPESRIEEIKKLVSNEINDPDELKSLLLQEIMISSSLQNIAANENRQLKQVYNCFKKGNGEFDLNKALEYAKKASEKCKSNADKSCSSDSEWRRWAKNLYYGLTQINAESQSDLGLRIAIEEASLTTIGTQVLQNRLNSLRIQKSVMKSPVVEKPSEVGITVPLICVISCIRMTRRARSSISYSSKRKAKKWSQRTPFEF